MSKSKHNVLEIVLIFSIVAAVIVRFLLLTRHEFWYDETLSVLLSSGQKLAYEGPKAEPLMLGGYASLMTIPPEAGLADTLTTIENLLKGLAGDVHPPLFYLSQHLWMRWFGNGEAAMRSLVAITSVGAIAASYGLGRTVLDHRSGLILAALLASSPFFLSHSLNLRMYALLVLWAILSQWSLLSLIKLDQSAHLAPKRRLVLMAGLAVSIAAGLMTQYLFTYGLVALAIAILVLGRRYWWQYAATLLAGVVLVLPWMFWGARQQINNRSDVLTQISEAGSWWSTCWRHAQGITQTLANYLLLGHWSAGFEPLDDAIKPVAVAIGWVLLVLLTGYLAWLYRQRAFHLLTMGFLLGILPLLVALGLDIVGNTFTLGFGEGRSTIVALPGLLLLIAGGFSQLNRRWQGPLIGALLALYWVVGVGNFTMRDRHLFHTVADWVAQAPSQSTLIAMNSSAWGNVLRLSYYVNSDLPVQFLADKPQDLAASVTRALDTHTYDRVLWLNTRYPVWSGPKTDAEAEQFQQALNVVLERQYQLSQEQFLAGTMSIDQFTLRLYQHSAAAQASQ